MSLQGLAAGDSVLYYLIVGWAFTTFRCMQMAKNVTSLLLRNGRAAVDKWIALDIFFIVCARATSCHSLLYACRTATSS